MHHLTITYRCTTVKQVIPQLFAFLLRNFRNSAIRYNNFIFVNAATLIQHSLDIPSMFPRYTPDRTERFEVKDMNIKLRCHRENRADLPSEEIHGIALAADKMKKK